MAEILVDHLTTGKIRGTGVFDELMTSMQARLDEQYSKTRLKGVDYSKVYLGSMEKAMEQSILFLLGRQKADKEADLIDIQIGKAELEKQILEKGLEKADAEICILAAQCLNESKKGLLLDEQIVKTAAEAALTDAKAINEVKQGLILDKGPAKIDAEIRYLNAQADNMLEQYKLTQEELNKIKAEIIVIQVTDEKVVAETTLIDQKRSTEITQGKKIEEERQLVIWQTNAEESKVNDTFNHNSVNKPVNGSVGLQKKLLTEQQLKTRGEGRLIEAKQATESAQTSDSNWHYDHVTGFIEGDAAKGVIGKQKTVLSKQAVGYDRNAEIAAVKAMGDAYAVSKGVDESTVNPRILLDPTSVYNGALETAWAKAKANLG